MARFRLNVSQIAGGIIVPVGIIVIIVVGYFVLLPKYRALQTTRAGLVTAQAETVSRSAQFVGIKDLAADLQKKQDSLGSLEEVIPAAPRIPELLANFDALAQQSGLFLADLQVTPAPATPSATAVGQTILQSKRVQQLLVATRNLGIIQINTTVRGNYGNLKTFLLNLEQNLRLMDVQGVVVTSGTDKTNIREFALVINTYYQK